MLLPLLTLCAHETAVLDKKEPTPVTQTRNHGNNLLRNRDKSAGEVWEGDLLYRV